MALAGLGRAIEEREAEEIIGVQTLPRNIAPDSIPTGTDRFAAAKPAPTDLEAAKGTGSRSYSATDKAG